MFSGAFRISVEAFQNFDEKQVVNIISNGFDNGAFLNTGHSATFNVNSIEKWLDALEKINIFFKHGRKMMDMVSGKVDFVFMNTPNYKE